MTKKDHNWFEYLSIQRPGRYLAREWNSISKDSSSCKVRMILAFPDVYEIGMSYHGFRILYERINSHPEFAAERAFAPWRDAENLFNQNKIPLCSLETGSPLNQFDVIGFTLQHELLYSNILTMLYTGDVPLKSSERCQIFPLVIGGGAGALSPEPLADFFDAFVIGDGEEVTMEILKTIRDFKAQGKGTREDIILKLKDIPGVYIPSLYSPEYAPDHTISAIKATREDIPETIRVRRYNIALDKGPVCPIVPNLRITQERFAIEVRRGCSNGCRFCQAGMINRPLRERPAEQILEIAQCGIKNTGYEEISLLALSTADYSRILPLLSSLKNEFAPKGVNVSLPSIRINSCDLEILDSIQSVRQSGLTLAPEAGTERLRRIINKSVDDATLLEIIHQGFSSKRRTLKLYFMVGLPTETKEDLDGIIQLIGRVENTVRQTKQRNYTINVTLSPFVPKAHTPFQWEDQCNLQELKERIEYIKSRIKSKRISIKSHNIDQSFLEAVFARGDRRLGMVLLKAWELGCRFDSWDESFHPDLWQQAFGETGIDPLFYANRKRGENEIFPWDHIHAGVNKSFLLREWKRGLTGDVTPDCIHGVCLGCGACQGEPGYILAPPIAKAPPSPFSFSKTPRFPVIQRQRLRTTYAKKGPICLISHLDLCKTMLAVLNRAGIPMAFTQGFNPLPKVQYGPPLSLGFESARELIDLFLCDTCDPNDVLTKLNENSPPGLEFLKIEEAPLKGPSLGAIVAAVDFELTIPEQPNPQSLSRLQSFVQSRTWPVKVPKRTGWIEKDLKKSIMNLNLLPGEKSGCETTFQLRISLEDNNYIDPRTALMNLLNLENSMRHKMRVVRTNIILRT